MLCEVFGKDVHFIPTFQLQALKDIHTMLTEMGSIETECGKYWFTHQIFYSTYILKLYNARQPL